ncbi:MAG TPA: hypothetical protein VH134_02515 [Candidatus Dormibacteraeota bacterium]|nr:hypothetical protein [Candidatus Dormibacteraeota bacterium]
MGVIGSRQRRPEPLHSRLYRSLLNLLYLRQPPATVCHDCQVDYVPELTDNRCPICGTLVGEAPVAVRRSRRRDLAGVGLCWVVGIIVFLLLVHALYG